MKTKLKFWAMANAGFATGKILQRELVLFHKLHPDIEVECEILTWSKAWQKLVWAVKRHLARTELPDVVQIGNTWQATLTALGGLRDLNGSVDRASQDDFLKPLFESCLYNGSSNGHKKIYAVPWFSDVRVLYYRTDILRKVGFSPSQIHTWQGFHNALREIKRRLQGQIVPMSLSGQSETIQIHDLATWIWSANGDFLDMSRKKSAIQKEESVKAIQFYFDLIQKGYVPLQGKDTVSSGNFFRGNSAFQISGVCPMKSPASAAGAESSLDFESHFGCTLVPAGEPDSRSTTFMGGSLLAILSSSEHPEEAGRMIRHFTLPENQERHAKQIGFLPARSSSLKESFFESGWESAGKTFLQAVEQSRTLPSIPVLGSVEQLVRHFSDRVLEKIRAGEYQSDHIREMIDETAVAIDEVLSLYGQRMV